jgi:hypothetical protein
MSACTEKAKIATNQLIIGPSSASYSNVVSAPKPLSISPFGLSSFDTQTALSGFYLWLLFGFLSGLLSCDLQHLVNNNMYVRHLIALVCFFFLFTILDQNNNTSYWKVWLKTIFVYVIFLITTKTNAWASVIIVVILIADQTVKMEMAAVERSQDVSDPSVISKLKRLKNFRHLLSYGLIVAALIGFIFYYMKQKKIYGEDFDAILFLLGNHKCQ